MPTYEYRCDSCGEQLEVIQSFTDPALTKCPHCADGQLRKLFGNVGVVFKGSGFYRNDSRNDGTPKTAPAKDTPKQDGAKEPVKADSSKSDSGKSGSSDSTPAGKSSSDKPAAAKKSA